MENCTISGVAGAGITFNPNTASNLYINNVTLRNNASGAISIVPVVPATAVASINNMKAEGNARGIIATEGSKVMVRNSIVSASGVGYWALSSTGAATEMTIENSVVSGFVTAGPSGGIKAEGNNAIVRISNVTSTLNSTGLQATGGGQIISFGNNRISGNTINGAPTSTVLPGQI